MKKKPDFLFVQNPSAILTLLAIFLNPFFRYKLIVDAHNAGVYPFDPEHEKFGFLFSFMHRNAAITIVTNSFLADIVEHNGGKATILPDPLPQMVNGEIVAGKKKECCRDVFIVTFVCSYAIDEPYLEVFKASALLPSNIKIYATGNERNLEMNERRFAQKCNIVFTGFLDEEAYIDQLCNSNCIMVLTHFNDCMVCGAYEGVALKTPLILSDSPVLRNWFERGVVFTENNSIEIANAILFARKDFIKISADVKLLSETLFHRWNTLFEKALDDIIRA